jgi:hypothetical protein
MKRFVAIVHQAGAQLAIGRLNGLPPRRVNFASTSGTINLVVSARSRSNYAAWISVAAARIRSNTVTRESTCFWLNTPSGPWALMSVKGDS